jgi:hypothetical protein
MPGAARPLARSGILIGSELARLDADAVEICRRQLHRLEIMVACDRCRKPRMGKGDKENVNISKG